MNYPAQRCRVSGYAGLIVSNISSTLKGLNHSGVVVLEPDVAKFFSNAETVNDSLRALAGIIRRQKAVAK